MKAEHVHAYMWDHMVTQFARALCIVAGVPEHYGCQRFDTIPADVQSKLIEKMREQIEARERAAAYKMPVANHAA